MRDAALGAWALAHDDLIAAEVCEALRQGLEVRIVQDAMTAQTALMVEQSMPGQEHLWYIHPFLSFPDRVCGGRPRGAWTRG